MRRHLLGLRMKISSLKDISRRELGGNKREGPPRAADWDKVARLVKFLKKIYEATLKFSVTKHVTANEPLLWMCTIIGELEKCICSDDPLLVSIGTSMKRKFDKYWLQLEDLNKILLIALILDPRYKLLYLEFFFPRLQFDEGLVALMIQEVKNTLSKLFDEYADSDLEAAAVSRSVTLPRIEYASVQVDEDSHAENLHQFKLLRQKKYVVVFKNKIDKYLLEAVEDLSNKKFVALNWWKENASRFPILSKIVKDVFAVPTSTMAFKAAFSLGKRIVDPFRASLTPKMVE